MFYQNSKGSHFQEIFEKLYEIVADEPLNLETSGNMLCVEQGLLWLVLNFKSLRLPVQTLQKQTRLAKTVSAGLFRSV